MYFFLRVLFVMVLVTGSWVGVAEAAVTINEVAWMGDESSVNHEWIELYNDGNTTVSVEGWTLNDEANLHIELSGSIPASSHVVLERTSDESATGPAFLIYTGALVNTGTTLTLRGAGEEMIDRVAGGENWENIGGDNSTKETAQYTPNGWVTDVATPGKRNNLGRVEIEEEPKTETKTDTTKTSSSKTKVAKSDNDNRKTVRLVEPNTVLKLETDIQTVAYVNQNIPFVVNGSGVGEKIIDSLKYEWNFGDTNTASGKKVSHAYAYPGKYVVTVRGAYARHDQVTRHEITVLPVNLSLTRNEAGDVQVNNDSPYDVDISGYVVQGEEKVVFPPRSIILPSSTITIPQNKLGRNEANLVAIYDAKENVVNSILPEAFRNYLALSEPTKERVVVGGYETRGGAATLTSEITPVSAAAPPLVISSETVAEDPVRKPENRNPLFTFAQEVDEETTVATTTETENNEETLSTTTIATSSSDALSAKELKDRFITTTFASGSLPVEDGSVPSKSDNKWPYVAFIVLLIVTLFGIFWGRKDQRTLGE